MLENQKDHFALDESIIYLNGAYMSPQLTSVAQTGIEQLKRKSSPNLIGVDDFFEPRKELKKRFASLILAEDYNSIAIIASASYGIASVTNNIAIEEGDEIVICEGQFPSHVYAWQAKATKNRGVLVEVKAPPPSLNKAEIWNERLLQAINSKTKVVATSQVHWADGTRYDLVAIREKTFEVGAKLVIDGTQSVGAMPFSVSDIQPDALICAGYKWLMGPYGIGVGYFAESFWDGDPIEHNWLNRYNSEDFANLTSYQPAFQPGAERFSVGESSNFILTSMLTKGIEQTIKWKPNQVQEYCGKLINDGIERLRSKGCFVEDERWRGNHLFGVFLPENLDKGAIKKRLQDRGIFVSYRGNAIRVSPHVYNNQDDIDQFVDCVF